MNVRFASARLILRPAPCDAELNDAALPRPRTMYEPVPIEPGMMPSSPAPGADRALAGDQHVLAVVRLLGDVVVVAGDRLARRRTAARERASRTRVLSSAIMTARLRRAYSCAQYRSRR